MGSPARPALWAVEEDQALSDTARLLAAARSSGTPRVFTRIAYDGATAAIELINNEGFRGNLSVLL
jgi:nicotinamidase-related amidase